jgi:ketosteroid isomerase-like protein
MSNENVELIRAGFEVFAKDGLEGLLPFVDPEIEVYAEQTVLNAGTFHGHEGFVKWSEAWFEAWQELSYEALDFIEVSDGVVVVPARQTATGAGSGIEIEQEIDWMIEVRDGKITRFHLYADRDAALAAAERLSRGEDPIPSK